jgi:hypothetical protein
MEEGQRKIMVMMRYHTPSLAARLVKIPAKVLLGLLVGVDSATWSDSLEPLMCPLSPPFALPFRWPFGLLFLGFFALPLDGAAIAAAVLLCSPFSGSELCISEVNRAVRILAA